jgi:hypothetical protein
MGDIMARTNVAFATCLMLICWAAAVVPATAQHFKQIDGSLTQIAVGRAEVWGLNGSEVYRFDSSTEKFNKMSGSLAQIAVGGGSILQRDEVWGVSASGSVYQFSYSKNKLVKIKGDLKQIAVGEGDYDNCHPYEVWGIDPTGNVWRYNYCNSQFETADAPSSMAQIAVAPNDVWGLDEYGNVYHLSPFGSGQTTVGNNGTLKQIAVGVDEAWGIDSTNTLYKYWGNYDLDGFVAATIPCSGVSSLCGAGIVAAGGDGVWVQYVYTQGGIPFVGIARYVRSTDHSAGSAEGFANEFSIPAGTHVAQQLVVGSGGGVWAIIASQTNGGKVSNQVYVFVRP